MANDEKLYTHEQYRKARVAHLVTKDEGNEFYLRSKKITQEQANQIVEQYLEEKGKISSSRE